MERFSSKEALTLQRVRNNLGSECTKCNDGWIEDKECDCRKVFCYLKELVYAKVPRDYWLTDLKKMHIKPPVSKLTVVKYISKFEVAMEHGFGICFSGRNGVGKTSMLIEIGKKAVAMDKKTFYMTTQDYINIKMSNDLDELAKIENCDVLLLDELDKVYIKKNSDYVVSQLENLLRLLIPKNVVVCFATNWTFDEAEKNLGDSVLSIIRRKIKMLSIVGEDHSDKLQSEWEDRLERKSESYLRGDIIKLANEMERFNG